MGFTRKKVVDDQGSESVIITGCGSGILLLCCFWQCATFSCLYHVFRKMKKREIPEILKFLSHWKFLSQICHNNLQNNCFIHVSVSLLRWFSIQAPCIHNPDENPCHACAPVMVLTITGTALPSSLSDQSCGHRRYTSSAFRPTVHPVVSIKSVHSSAAKSRRFSPKLGDSLQWKSYLINSCHSLHSSQQTVWNNDYVTAPWIYLQQAFTTTSNQHLANG